jgi:predicted nucleic acid-binding protein
MSKTVYDTRFFVEHYYSKDKRILQKTKHEIRKTKQKYISATVIHEIYHLTLKTEGRQTAKLRTNLLAKDFRTVNVDANSQNISRTKTQTSNPNGRQHNSSHNSNLESNMRHR